MLIIASSDPDSFGVYSELTTRGGREVRGYMFDDQAREDLVSLSQFLADLAKISDNFIIPENDEELACLAANVLRAKRTGTPVTLYTPLCPDWSMDSEGRYDFKSLSGQESFIAKKFFKYSPEFLKVLSAHKIPYEGILMFADWGMETDLMDKNTYGTKLTQQDIRMCFDSSLAAVDEHLSRLQSEGDLFTNFRVVAMTRFLEESGLDLDELDGLFRKFFTNDIEGRKLLMRLSRDSYPINKERMGLSKEKSDEECLENLVDYAIFGQALSGHGILIACESRTTSLAYNLPRSANNKVPMLFVKGKGRDSGVNIL